MTAFSRYLVLLTLLAALPLLSGCTGYRLGSSLPQGIKTVYVPTFINRTGEPQLETEASMAAMQEFQKDGTLSVATEESADTILSVTIKSIREEPVRFTDTKTASEYRLIVDADLEFKKRAGNEILMKRSVYGQSTFKVAGDLPSSRRTALKPAAMDLAHQIVTTVVEFW
jgi:hypothetical protein